MSIGMLRKRIKGWIRSQGYECRKLSLGELDDLTRLVRLCESRHISTFLDVGANRGQFAIDLRVAGYTKRIISFEPLSQAHARLSNAAASDPGWVVMPRVAVGQDECECTINISGNSFSSSLLPMKESHVMCAPSSSYIGEERVLVRPLPLLLQNLSLPSTEPLALKIDTQGFEAKVINGAKSLLQQVKIIFTELSLVPLYDGAPEFYEMYHLLIRQGYRCVALSHEFSDPHTGEMLQVNGTFVRN